MFEFRIDIFKQKNKSKKVVMKMCILTSKQFHGVRFTTVDVHLFCIFVLISTAYSLVVSFGFIIVVCFLNIKTGLVVDEY